MIPPWRAYHVDRAPKVGFIFECTDGGPDMRVCKRFLEILRARLRMDALGLSNKRHLRMHCGRAARHLLDSGCERVVILWDLVPPCWDEAEEDVSLYRDVRKIRASLQQHAVALDQVALVCQIEMLEAWLMADHRAVRSALERVGRRPLRRRLARYNSVESISDPKGTLELLFEVHLGKGNYYRDHQHAYEIADGIQNTDFLRRSWTFRRFAEKAARVNLP